MSHCRGQMGESHAPGGVRGFQDGQSGGRGRGWPSRLMSGQCTEERYRQPCANSSNGLQQYVPGGAGNGGVGGTLRIDLHGSIETPMLNRMEVVRKCSFLADCEKD